MQDPLTTRIIKRPDGTEVLQVPRVRLVVKRGPDKGKESVLEQPFARVGSGARCDLRLDDPAVSNVHFELRATERGLRLTDPGSTNGTFLGGIQIQEALLTGIATLDIGESCLQLTPLGESVEIPLSMRRELAGLLGQSQQMRQLFTLLERIAPTETSVLLQGESGTGKELVAQALHKLSARASGPFVVLDCGAIPASLIESELFGHEKGAFTGAASAREGSLAAAHLGTLFLDELGELPLELQPRLLRFLEGHQVKRLGATHHRTVDVRVIAATNRDLLAEVESGRFRQDLYYRVSVVKLELPPLRERPDDILLLAHHFAGVIGYDPRTAISKEVAGMLTGYWWPGNVRELRNVVERFALLPEAGTALFAEQNAQAPQPHIGALAELPFHEARRRWQDLFERQYLRIQLARHQGTITKAAAAADLPRQTFHKLMKRQRL